MKAMRSFIAYVSVARTILLNFYVLLRVDARQLSRQWRLWRRPQSLESSSLRAHVYRAIIGAAHANGQQVLAHLSRTSALADAKDLFRAGIDGFVHTDRDRDVDQEYLELVKAPGELLQLDCRNLQKSTMRA